MLDNLATFASFVSQFTPIKILLWQEKKDNNYDIDDTDKLRQEFEMWMSKTFLSSQWVYTRLDESRRPWSEEYLVWASMPKSDITNTAYTSRDVRREKSKYLLILAFKCTLDYLFPQRAGRSIFVVTYRARYRFIKAGLANTLKNWYFQTLFCSI